jgi:hypothetical protein
MNNKTASKAFVVIMVLLFILGNFLYQRSKSIDLKEIQAKNEIKRIQDSIQFPKDSLLILSFNKLKDDSINTFENATVLYNKLRKLPESYNTRKDTLIKHLLQLPCTKKLTYQTLDEFDNSVIKSIHKTSNFIFKEWVDSLSKNNGVFSNIKGFKNGINQKAFNLHKKYGWNKTVCLTIAKGQISIGMSPTQVRTAWGQPVDINETISSNYVQQQWVYSENYVYFEGPNRNELKLTTIQD